MVTVDVQVRGVLVPRGATVLAAVFEEDLFVHEPDLRITPQAGDEIGDRGAAQHTVVRVALGRGWVAQVLVERPVDPVERARGGRAGMVEAPVERRTCKRQLI